MNILIINVALRPESAKKLFPIGLGYIATAMKRSSFEFDLIDIDAHRYSDQQVESFIRKKKCDVVCMGWIVTGYKIIKRLSSVIKMYHPHAKIVVGNSVATSIVDTLLTCTEVDIAVMGEGDITIIDLLEAISKSMPIDEVRGICFRKDGAIFRTPARPLITDLSTLPFIDYSIFDIEIYLENSKNWIFDKIPVPREDIRALPVNTARGCIARCGFCYHVFQGMKYRYRTPDSIVAEIRDMIDKYSLNCICFFDELTFFSKKQALQLSSEILEENIKIYWTADCRAALFNDKKDLFIINKIKEAGCVGLGYSLESAEPDILKAMNKHLTVEQFSKQTALLREGGIATLTSLVFGYPQETPETIKKTFDCCIENKVYPSAGYLLPQPGSQIYKYATIK